MNFEREIRALRQLMFKYTIWKTRFKKSRLGAVIDETKNSERNCVLQPPEALLSPSKRVCCVKENQFKISFGTFTPKKAHSTAPAIFHLIVSYFRPGRVILTPLARACLLDILETLICSYAFLGGNKSRSRGREKQTTWLQLFRVCAALILFSVYRRLAECELLNWSISRVRAANRFLGPPLPSGPCWTRDGRPCLRLAIGLAFCSVI